MPRYLIEGSCDGGLFAEGVDANSQEDAEAFAIVRLCEAWGEEYTQDTMLDDLGDSASVTEYSADDYARDAATDLLAVLKRLLPEIDDEIEQRQHSGNAEYWAGLQTLSDEGHAAVAKATGTL